VPLETPVQVANELARRGYNADPDAVVLIAAADDTGRALERSLETVPADAVKLTARHVQSAVEPAQPSTSRNTSGGETTAAETRTGENANPPVSAGTGEKKSTADGETAPVETTGMTTKAPANGGDSPAGEQLKDGTGDHPGGTASRGSRPANDSPTQSMTVRGDFASTGTGEYEDFVAVFRDRYERLAGQLRSRVNHRPTDALESLPGGNEAAVIGMVADIRSTANGHWLVELEDTNGVFPCLVMSDRDLADAVDELLLDEVVAIEGTLADDGGLLFADTIQFPDVPRTYEPATADREVAAALVSDVHVGSQEFMAAAWNRFADWLHTPTAAHIEYLLIAGDMVEGVGVYPDQDEELDIVDMYEQYEAFAEQLKAVPGDLEIVMIPGNHDAVRLAEPQPAFEEDLQSIMSAHDARISGNPSTVTLEGVDVLMYHGVSLDEVIAELPDSKATYDNPHQPMAHLLKKRHLAPQFGGQTRLAPEEEDHLVIDDVPDVFHAGHVHKLGYGTYHNVLTINSGCWQAQTSFQESVNIDPDHAFAPVLSLDTLELTIRDFN
jgi:DNA polymerase II small subunit